MKQAIKRPFICRRDIRILPLCEIDHHDRFFATIPDWWQNERLERSIEKVGIITPVHVQGRETGLQIISGFQRVAAAHRLKIDHIPCLLIDGTEPLTLFLQSLWENTGSRELHEIEKARALTLLLRNFGVNEVDLVESYLPMLGMKRSRYHLNRLLEIDSLPETFKKASVECGLSLDLALKIVSWGPEEHTATLRMIRKLRPGRNKQKILIDLLDDLRVLLATSVAEIWDEASGVIGPDNTRTVQRLDELIEHLQRRKYPRLSRHKDRYNDLRGQLSIPPTIQLTPPPFFEGTGLSFSFSASSLDELDQITLKLRELTGREELHEIFKLV